MCPPATVMFMTNSMLLWWTLESNCLMIRQCTATTRDQAERCKGSSAMERKCKVTLIKLN